MNDKVNAQSIVVANRVARALELRVKGWTYQAIADELGYAPPNGAIHVSNDVRRAMDAARTARNDNAESYRELELARLDALVCKVNEILERRHYLVRDGQCVTVDGERVVDDAVALQAVDRLEKLSASRRKLLGLDAPTMVQTTNVTYAIEGFDMDVL